jgi:hypothetical protein
MKRRPSSFNSTCRLSVLNGPNPGRIGTAWPAIGELHSCDAPRQTRDPRG